MATTSLAEKVLGRRTVNYLKNEALVGRISKHKLQARTCLTASSSYPNDYLHSSFYFMIGLT